MITFKEYETKYFEEVINLLKPLWSNLINEQCISYFKWKYYENPSMLFVAIDSKLNKIVGFRGYLLIDYHSSEDFLTIAVLSDTIVDFDYRGQKIFQNLTFFSIEKLSKFKKIQFIINLSNFKWNTDKGYRNIGFEYFSKKIHRYRINWFNLFLYPFYKNIIKQSNDYQNRNLKYEISNDLNTEDVIKLYENFNTENRITKCISEKYLNWRFKNPIEKYYFAYLYKNGILIAYAAFVPLSKRRFYIIEFAFSSTKYFVNLIKYFQRKTYSTVIYSWELEQDIKIKKDALSKAGFLNLYFLKTKTPNALVRPAQIILDNNCWYYKGVDIRNPSKWSINLLDNDCI